MKTTSILTAILLYFASNADMQAQFNTIGYANNYRTIKQRNPPGTKAAISGDCMTMNDSLRGLPVSNTVETQNGKTPKSTSGCKPPYLSAAFPLKSVRISSKFGMRFHPVTHRYCMHNGVDLQADYETVFAMFPGEVISVGEDGRSGKYVTIQTAGYTISYCHLSASWVAQGSYINAGAPIGLSGNTGLSTGPHLHLTTKKDGKAIDPAILLNYIQAIKDMNILYKG